MCETLVKSVIYVFARGNAVEADPSLWSKGLLMTVVDEKTQTVSDASGCTERRLIKRFLCDWVMGVTLISCLIWTLGCSPVWMSRKKKRKKKSDVVKYPSQTDAIDQTHWRGGLSSCDVEDPKFTF